ncbi:MAG: response regulator [Verrucomicrobiales bacterium]|nr:response regulator [Verrucomicrobiales bacterium]
MEKKGNFALVRKSSSAIEKVAPGAKRILSGMVADAHALAKNKERKKLRIVVLDDEEGPRRSCVAMFKSCWPNGAEILEFENAHDAWQELSRADPDLFITDITHPGMTCLDTLTGLAERKVKYPVLVISARLGLELEAEKYPEAAAYIHELKRDRRPNLHVYFLPKPYTPKEFQTALEAALKIPRASAGQDEIMSLKTSLAAEIKPKFSVAVCGVSPYTEFYNELLKSLLQEVLPDNFEVELNNFIYVDRLLEAAQKRQFNLYFIFLNPRLPGEFDAHELIAHLKTRFQKPIVILTNEFIYGLDAAAGFEQAGADAFFSFLPPFPLEGFKEALKECVGMKQLADMLALAKKPFPRIVLAFSNHILLQSNISLVIKSKFKDSIVLTFDDSKKAWHNLSQTDPSLLVADYDMLRLGGEEMLRHLLDRKSTYPIILLCRKEHFNLPEQDLREHECKRRGLNVQFLFADYDSAAEIIVEALETALENQRAIVESDTKANFQNFLMNEALDYHGFKRYFLRKAAELGHIEAMYRWGMDFVSGDGFPQDNKQAAYWFNKAAERGHAGAQLFLGKDVEYAPLKRRGKLLVVDDEDGPRQSMRVIFKDEYDLLMAEDGPTAIELAKQHDVDVVVTNIRMAGMSGIEMLERLKLLNPNIEVIISTAFRTTDTVRRAFRLGACDYINKPFDIATMRYAVSNAMQRRTLEMK